MRDHYTSSWKWLEKLLLRVAESRSVNWQISLIFLFQQINHPEHIISIKACSWQTSTKNILKLMKVWPNKCFTSFITFFIFSCSKFDVEFKISFFWFRFGNSELRFHFPDLQLHRKIVRMYKEYQLYQKNELRTYESNVVYIYIPYIWLPGKNLLNNYMLLIKVGRKICN